MPRGGEGNGWEGPGPGVVSLTRTILAERALTIVALSASTWIVCAVLDLEVPEVGLGDVVGVVTPVVGVGAASCT